MTNHEKANQLIENIKGCQPNEVGDLFQTFFGLYPLLSKNEKNEIVSSYYKWAEEHTTQEPFKFAYSKYLLGHNAYFHEDYETSLNCCTEAKKLFFDQNEPNEVAVCSAITSVTYRTIGNADLALKELWEAYRQLKKTGRYTHTILVCSLQIGSIYIEMKNPDEALPMLLDTLQLAGSIHNDIWVMNACQGLGRVYLMQKNYAIAKECIEKGAAIAEKINSPTNIAIFKTEQGIYYAETGDTVKAEELHFEAMNIRKTNGLIGGEITNCIRLSELYISQSRNDEAIAILSKGMELAEQIKVKPKIYEIHRLLSEVYEQINETEKSLHHYKLFHKIRDEVETEDNAKKIKNLQLVFEAEQTMKENVIIKRQKEEIEHKNIELQETIDELTLSKVNRKAKALTLIIAIALFIMEDVLLDFVLHKLPEDNFLLSIGAKMVIIFTLKPIEKAVEHHLLKKVIKRKKREVLV